MVINGYNGTIWLQIRIIKQPEDLVNMRSSYKYRWEVLDKIGGTLLDEWEAIDVPFPDRDIVGFDKEILVNHGRCVDRSDDVLAYVMRDDSVMYLSVKEKAAIGDYKFKEV